ncbi:MAG: hypothetical protein COA79_16800 [Planctomycetota bacterium]|nr:MAG: hypothetical protein COA79_16800 [Planctomycetota bacterium]
MNTIKTFLINNGEKVLFGIIALFCVYSIFLSIISLLSGSDDYSNISKFEKEIKKGLKKEATIEVSFYDPTVEEILSDRMDTSHLEPFSNLVISKLFSEKTLSDPYENIKDIINGHSKSNSEPGKNCAKFFAKVGGNDTCIVCGSKGERVYIYKAAILTKIKSLSMASQEELKSNPYVDRKTIRIIWEDNILSDRTNYKKRVANVYRFEVDDKKASELNTFIGKPEYQKSIRDFIKKYNLKPSVNKSGKLILIIPNTISDKVSVVVPNAGNKPKPNIGSLFDEEEEEEEEEKKPEIENKNLNKLIKEKVFYKFVDDNFEPLKKYMYILVVKATGKSANLKKIEETKTSDPVEVTTNAENVFYLTKVKENLNQPGKYHASFQIYQYFKFQNGFYKMSLSYLVEKDLLGSHYRKSSGDYKDIRVTRIYKKKLNARKIRVPKKGSELTDSQWQTWRKLYPEMRERAKPILINLKYVTGYKIIKIGFEDKKVKPFLKWGPKLDANHKEIFDKNGKKVLEKKFGPARNVNIGFVVLQNELTNEKKTVYVKKSYVIKDELKEQKINTIGN